MNTTPSELGWQEIASIRSFTNPTKRYHIALNAKGYLGCSCPNWVHGKVPNPDGSVPPCKHIVGLLNESLEHEGFEATMFGLTWLAKRIAANL